MIKCSERKSPPDNSDVSWRKCGQYNDWTINSNFCTAQLGLGDDSANFCNNIGGEGEWKLKQSFSDQFYNHPDSFISGGVVGPNALQTVLDPTSDDFKATENESNSYLQSLDLAQILNGSISSDSDSRGFAPLLAQSEYYQTAIPLWQNWFDEYGSNEEQGCDYDSWRKDKVQKSGTCCYSGYGSCGIVGGHNAFCIRNEFAGSVGDGAVSCCFNDLVCESNSSGADRLFSDPGQDGQVQVWSSNNKCFRSNSDYDMRTCKPESRNLGNAFCRNAIEPYCTGSKIFPGQVSWEAAWDENSLIDVNGTDVYRGKSQPNQVAAPCLKYLMRQISGLNSCNQTFSQFKILPQTYSLDGMLNSQQLITQVFEKYISDYGSPLLGVDSDGFEASVGVNNFLFNICQKFPALCTTSLTQICKNVTEENIAENPIAGKWCGCYMADDQYTKYTDSNLVSKECTPFCSRDGVIPLVDSNYQPLPCLQNICVINDVTLNLIKTEGGITFNDVCNTCGQNRMIEKVSGGTQYSEEFYEYERSIFTVPSGENYNYYSGTSVFNSYGNEDVQRYQSNCSCILNGLDLESLNSKFNSVNFSSNCGNVQCTDNNGNYIPCSGVSGKNKDPLPKIDDQINAINDVKSLSLFKKLVVLSIIFLFVSTLFYIFFGNKKKIFIDSVGDVITLSKNQRFEINNGYISKI